MLNYWSVPRAWPNLTCAVIASGASLTKEDVDFLAYRMPVIAVSDAWKLCPSAKYLYSCDAKWWQYHDGVPEYRGTKVGLDSKITYPDVKLLRMRTKPNPRGSKYSPIILDEGLDDDPRFLRTGCNSGYQAINLAYHLGANRIILLGFDMKGSHFFGEHPEEIRPGGTGSPFALWIAKFKTLADAFQERGIKVINCTPDSALPWFEKRDLRDVEGL